MKTLLLRGIRFAKRIVRSVLRRMGIRPVEKKREVVPQWITIRSGLLKGRDLFLDPHASLSWYQEMIEGSYDSFMYDAIQKYVDFESAIVWDVGGHIGYQSLCLAVLVGSSGRVVTFETNPYNAERFRLNLSRNPDLDNRIRLIDSALSSEDGETTFLVSPEIDQGLSAGGHLSIAVVPLQAKAYRTFSEITVTCVKGDTILHQLGNNPPSFIKIDVEGGELEVLKGCSKLLATHKPILFIEIHNVTMMFHVQKFLYDLDYELDFLPGDHSPQQRCFVIAHPKN